jgi:hypothetical protein
MQRAAAPGDGDFGSSDQSNVNFRRLIARLVYSTNIVVIGEREHLNTLRSSVADQFPRRH